MKFSVEQQAKIVNKNYKIKINTEANSDLVISKQKENAIKITPVKLHQKRVYIN